MRTTFDSRHLPDGSSPVKWVRITLHFIPWWRAVEISRQGSRGMTAILSNAVLVNDTVANAHGPKLRFTSVGHHHQAVKADGLGSGGVFTVHPAAGLLNLLSLLIFYQTAGVS
jgi:hypothetical protein